MAIPFQRESEETDRLLALSDGVIAIAITLLVLEITVPEVPAGTPPSVVADLVFEQSQEYVGYVLSFLVIGLYWTLHRRIFIHIEAHDRGIVWLNLLFLLLVAFVPYGTSVFSAYPNRLGVSVIAAVLALTGFSLAALWIHALRKQLLEAGLASRTVGIQAARFLASPLVFAGSIAVASVDPRWAMLSWVLLIPINGALNSRLVKSVAE
ncbi:TMEM175 family protein [Halomicroarcula sp. GCM10025709]|uniref:TMEM175 family protein n=1 Tax=Haloarcula TaxID=2237 RepID=UPI0024C452F8|nr:TMEM175 family protein [Halomicroarcula sp. YJ-61-S]